MVKLKSSKVENASEKRISELVKESLYRNFDHPFFVVNTQLEIRQSGGKLSLITNRKPETISGSLANILDFSLLEEVQEVFKSAINAQSTITGDIKVYSISKEKQYIKVVLSPLPTGEKEEKLFLVTLEINTKGLENLGSRDAVITKNLPGAIFKYKLNKDGSIEILNLTDGSKKIWGLSSEDAMEDPSRIWALIHPEDLEPLLQSIELSAKNLTEWNVDYRVNHPTLGLRWIRGIGNPMPAEDGEVVWNSIVMDVTDIKKAESEAKTLKALVLEAQKLARMGSWNFDFHTQELSWTDALYEVYEEEKAESPESRSLTAFRHLVVPEDLELYIATGKKARESGEPFHLEYSIITSSGKRKILEEYGYSEKDADGNVIRMYGTVQDITERKNTEVKVRESNQRFKLATKATSDVIWDWNIKSGEIVWGENYNDVFGKINDHAKFSDYQKVMACLHPEEKEKILLSADEVLKSQQTNWNYEHRWLKADGSYAYVSNKALVIRDKKHNAIRVIGAIQDITLKKEEEQQLRLMESVITNALDSVLITEAGPESKHGPKIIYANEAFCKMTGYAKNEILGKNPSMLQGELTDKNTLEHIRKSVDSFEPCDATLINYKKNGEPFWVNMSISPVADQKGNYTHWIAIERDVTKQKNKEIQKALLNEISQIFIQEEKLLNSLENILVHLAGYGGFELAEAWILSPDKTRVNLLSNYTAYEELTVFHSGNTGLNSCSIGEGLPGAVWKSRKVELWNDLPKKKAFNRKGAAVKTGIQTALGVPLLHNEEVVGILLFMTKASVESVESIKELFQNFQAFLGGELKRKLLEEELNQLFVTAPDLICVAGLDGYFKKINPAACRLLEYSEEELLSRQFFEFLHPEDRAITETELESLSLGIKTQYFENRYLTKSGKTIWLGWSSTTSLEEGLVYAVARDITNQKNLQNMLDTASSLAQIGAWEVDLTTNTHFWSSVTRDIHEVPEDYTPNFEEAVNFYRGDYYDFVSKTVEKSLAEGTGFDFEVPIITAKGNEKWIRAIGNIEFRIGKPVKLFGSFQDITQRKTYENSLRKLNLELKKQTRDLSLSNSELEQFAYVASHDLQEPLRMVSSFLTQLEKQYTDLLDDKGKQYIQFAVDGAKRMKSIILDLLDFSRVGKHQDELAEIDLNDIVEESKTLYFNAIVEADAKLTVSQLPKIKGFKTPFSQLFQNLISNALKYKREDVSLEIVIDCDENEKEWTIRIQDNGIGIEKDFFEKIFIIFQRLHHKNKYSGTGMGLAIVKKIVENMGGRIWVESTINEGSTFFFTIPKKN